MDRIFHRRPERRIFAAAIENIEDLLVPSLTIYEVFKWISRERGEAPAVKAVAHMQQGEVVDLDAKLAAYAARLSLQARLPMADSIVHATAHTREATLWTQDDDFKGMEAVKYVAKKKSAK